MGLGVRGSVRNTRVQGLGFRGSGIYKGLEGISRRLRPKDLKRFWAWSLRLRASLKGACHGFYNGV